MTLSRTGTKGPPKKPSVRPGTRACTNRAPARVRPVPALVFWRVHEKASRSCAERQAGALGAELSKIPAASFERWPPGFLLAFTGSVYAPGRPEPAQLREQDDHPRRLTAPGPGAAAGQGQPDLGQGPGSRPPVEETAPYVLFGRGGDPPLRSTTPNKQMPACRSCMVRSTCRNRPSSIRTSRTRKAAHRFSNWIRAGWLRLLNDMLFPDTSIAGPDDE